MRRLGTTLLLASLCACSVTSTGHEAADVAPVVADAQAPGAPAGDAAGSPAAPFAGSWQACDGAASPEECSRYVLVQRGANICGTWAYVASGQAYEGRVVARAATPTEARRTRICGRPGSETATECDAGWQPIDRPLLLCDGRLGDLVGADGACFADYARADDAGHALDALSAQPWVQDCLAGDPDLPQSP